MMLVRAELTRKQKEEPGNLCCGRNRCKTCPILLTTTTFISNTNGHQHEIRHSVNCKSYNIVYLIQCLKCGHQYVGETGQCLNQRMNSHRSDVVNHKFEGKPVSRHFNSEGHSLKDLRVMVIDRLWTNDPCKRKLRESKWISTLDMCWPRGMNIKSDSLF